MTMYKVGDKVGTPYGVGIVLEQDAKGIFRVSVDNYTIWFDEKNLTPYTSAHDKLLALGWEKEISKVPHQILYKLDDKRLWVDTQYKTFYICDEEVTSVDIDLELARIMVQYLEELE